MADVDDNLTLRAMTRFGREVGKVLPLRLQQLRAYGKSTRALSGRRPKPKGRP